LNLRYQRTQRMMISRSKWRPLKRSSMLSIWVRFLQRRVCGEYAPLLPFAPEPPYVRPLNALVHERWPRWFPRREFLTIERPLTASGFNGASRVVDRSITPSADFPCKFWHPLSTVTFGVLPVTG
jgi:hypothetical protein